MFPLILRRQTTTRYFQIEYVISCGAKVGFLPQCIQQMGNSRARAVYEANIPDSFRRPQMDSALEQFVRAKYEAKKYIAREWVQPPMPNPTWDLELEKQLRKKKREKVSEEKRR